MKISELIKELKEIQLSYGDLDCVQIKHDPYDFDFYLVDPEFKVIDNPCGDGKIVKLLDD